ncbi:hypothetical protein [Solimicrobium silvestre]|nr:hypothetical protein [Solimicrobium silvestre]
MLTIAVLQFSVPVFSASTNPKARYIATTEKAESDYKLARARCDRMADIAKNLCVAQAKAAQTQTESNATAVYKDTPEARFIARIDIADVNFEVKKAMCESRHGNPREECVKDAEATMVAEKQNAAAVKKIGEATSSPNDDRLATNYIAAIKKCDALNGVQKDDCAKSTKKQFGK